MLEKEPREITATKKQEMLERLLLAHEANFNVSRDYAFGGRAFPGYAEFHSTIEQYVLIKRAKLWGASAHEYLFFQYADRLTAACLDDLVGFMKAKAIEKVHIDSEHMTSYLSLVVIADSIDPDVPAKVRRSHFRKNFQLGFKGWADLRLAVVDLSGSRIVANAMGEELRPTLEANCF